MSTSKTTWKNFERWIATQLTVVFGVLLRRNPLSGANNVTDAGEPRPGDVIIPEGYDLLVEAKYRSANQQHTLYEGAVLDAIKHKINPRNVILYTKTKRQHGALVTISADLFHELLSLRGALRLLRKPKQKA